ncbi:MAG: hypothetical protein P4M11_07140 [Candidatus Pacebacteria bacterium]|nr:hypothetical protein [Candidatus Paceibacterota bacterium]
MDIRHPFERHSVAHFSSFLSLSLAAMIRTRRRNDAPWRALMASAPPYEQRFARQRLNLVNFVKDPRHAQSFADSPYAPWTREPPAAILQKFLPTEPRASERIVGTVAVHLKRPLTQEEVACN